MSYVRLLWWRVLLGLFVAVVSVEDFIIGGMAPLDAIATGPVIFCWIVMATLVSFVG